MIHNLFPSQNFVVSCHIAHAHEQVWVCRAHARKGLRPDTLYRQVSDLCCGPTVVLSASRRLADDTCRVADAHEQSRRRRSRCQHILAHNHYFRC
jgi:hypothetical protein